MLKDRLITQEVEFENNFLLNFEILSYISFSNNLIKPDKENKTTKFQTILTYHKTNKNLLITKIPIKNLPDSQFVTLNLTIPPDSKFKILNIEDYRILVSDPRTQVNISFDDKNKIPLTILGKVISSLRSYMAHFGIGLSLISYEQSSTFISFSQSLRIISVLRYLNINFGYLADKFIDDILGFHDSKLNSMKLDTYSSQINRKNTRGKLTSKKLPLFSNDRWYYQYIAYMTSSFINLGLGILSRNLKLKKEMIICYLYLIFYFRKLHFVLFNWIICELYFQGVRTLLHSTFSSLDKYQKLKFTCTLLSLIFSLIDISELLNTIYKLRHSRNLKENTKFGLKKPSKTNNMLIISRNLISRRNSHQVSPINNKLKIQIRKSINFEKSIFEIQKNKAIQEYIEERYSLSSKKQTVPQNISIISGIYYLRIIVVQVSIVTLQYLPQLAIIIILAVESLMILSQCYILYAFNNFQIKGLGCFRIISSALMFTFCSLCLFIYFWDEYPTVVVQNILMIVFVSIIIVEAGDLVFINIIIIKNWIVQMYKLMFSEGRHEDGDAQDDEYSVLYFRVSKVLKINYDRHNSNGQQWNKMRKTKIYSSRQRQRSRTLKSKNYKRYQYSSKSHKKIPLG